MPSSLSQEFLSHAGAAAAALGRWPALEETLRGLLARGRAAWPSLDIAPGAFLEHLAERVGPDPTRALPAVHAEDLYLALGCQLGLPAALAAFDAQHLSQVEGFLDSARKKALADEVRQLLRVRLLVGPTPQISTYTGRGALGGFVRIATVRLARDATRGKKNAATEDSDDVDAPMTAPDPELAYLKKRHAADFRLAFQRTLTGLPDEDRNILALSLFDGLTTEAIGKLYGVDGSTIRRRLARMRETILEETRKVLTERLKLKPGELESLFGLVRSELDLSIRRYLKR